MSTNVEPNEDVGESLEEKKRNKGEHWDKRKQMPGGLPLGELVVWRGVPDEEDGDGSQANVSHHVLIVTRLSSNLKV